MILTTLVHPLAWRAARRADLLSRAAPPRAGSAAAQPDAVLAEIAAGLARLARNGAADAAARTELLVAAARHWRAAAGAGARQAALALVDEQLARHGRHDTRRGASPDLAAQRQHLGPLARVRVLAALLGHAEPADPPASHLALVALLERELEGGALLADHRARLGCLLAQALPRLAAGAAAVRPRQRALEVLAALTRAQGKLGQPRAFELSAGPLAEIAVALPQLPAAERAPAARLLLTRLDLARRQALLLPARRAAHQLCLVEDHLRPWQKLLEARAALPPALQLRVTTRFLSQFDGEAALDARAAARLDRLYFWRAERWSRILARLPADARRAQLAAHVLRRIDAALADGGGPLAGPQAAAIERIGALCVAQA